jgi:hypothetical protein
MGGLTFTFGVDLRTSRSPRKYPPAGCLMLFGLPFLLMGLLFFSIAVYKGYMTLVGVRSWRPVEAVILSKELEVRSDPERDTFKPLIEYRYEVDGQTYTSKRYDITVISSSGRASKERILDRYEVGETVTAYYDPDDPAGAVLTREVSLEFVMFIIGGLVFSGVGGALVFGPAVVYGVRKAREARVQAGCGIKPEFETAVAPMWGYSLLWTAFTCALYLGFALKSVDFLRFMVLFPPLVLAGAVLFGLAIKATVGRWRFYPMRLWVSSSPIRPGETARWEVSDPRGATLAAAKARAALVQMREGKGRSRWRKLRGGRVSNVSTQGGVGPLVTGVLEVPPAPDEGTAPEPEDAEVRWYLRLKIGDERVHFPLPVTAA